MSSIHFGTDGWRAEMGRDFTFQQVRIFAGAYAAYLKKKFPGSIRVIVNYDTRFLSLRYAEEVAKVLSLKNIEAYIPDRDTPLPAISYFVVHENFQGAVNFTAGARGPVYNGIKLLNHRGAPESQKETKKIEKLISSTIHHEFKPQYADRIQLNNQRIRKLYLKYIEGLVDLELIRDSGLNIIVDNMYGSSRDYLDYILNINGLETISIHNFPYSSFGHLNPDCSGKSLKELSAAVLEYKADLGLATDINGLRFGVINSKGALIEPDTILPLLVEYLIKERRMKGGIIKSVSTTENIRKVGEHYLRRVHECPVGFKHLASEMEKRKVFIAVEGASGGTLNMGGRTRDGILFGLLIAEMMAFYKMGVDEVIDSFHSRFPKLYKTETIIRQINVSRSKWEQVLSGEGIGLKDLKVNKSDLRDGLKLYFDHSWLLIRESGTEPVFRIYAEAPTKKRAAELIQLGRGFIEKRKK